MTITPIHPGIVRITLPLPGRKPGPVHVYLFRGKQNTTLLDTGTFWSSRFLKSTLARLGLGFKDLQGIVLTHGHMDHCGAVRTIVRQHPSRVTVCAHRDEIATIQAGFDVPYQVYVRFLTLIGTPLPQRLAIRMMLGGLQMLARGAQVDHALHDGDHLTLGDYEATVVATPGHTRGSISLFLEKEGLLFSGDHILNHITPNALLMLEEDVLLPRRQSQKEYFDSLRSVAQLRPKTVHPAHGARIGDFDAIHRMYRNCFAQRQQALLSLLSPDAPASVYAITRKLFPQLGGGAFLLDLYLAIAETYSHLQELVADGRATVALRANILHATARY